MRYPRKWPYRRIYPCFMQEKCFGRYLSGAYCLILIEKLEKAIDEAANKYDLSPGDATLLAMMYKGMGVCKIYKPKPVGKLLNAKKLVDKIMGW